MWAVVGDCWTPNPLFGATVEMVGCPNDSPEETGDEPKFKPGAAVEAAGKPKLNPGLATAGVGCPKLIGAGFGWAGCPNEIVAGVGWAGWPKLIGAALTLGWATWPKLIGAGLVWAVCPKLSVEVGADVAACPNEGAAAAPKLNPGAAVDGAPNDGAVTFGAGVCPNDKLPPELPQLMVGEGTAAAAGFVANEKALVAGGEATCPKLRGDATFWLGARLIGWAVEDLTPNGDWELKLKPLVAGWAGVGELNAPKDGAAEAAGWAPKEKAALDGEAPKAGAAAGVAVGDVNENAAGLAEKKVLLIYNSIKRFQDKLYFTETIMRKKVIRGRKISNIWVRYRLFFAENWGFFWYFDSANR